MTNRLSILALAIAMATGTAFAASEGEVSEGEATSKTTDAGASGPTAGGDIQGDLPAPGVITDFERIDADRDEQLTREELGEDHPQLSDRFDDLDRNEDGMLDRSEFSVFEEEYHVSPDGAETRDVPGVDGGVDSTR